MFSELSIVSTAISSFNNAALFSPYFFIVGVLSIPLFYFVYLYSGDILSRLKWNRSTESMIGFWSVLFLTIWLLIFGGNYAVIRDGISLLSIMIAICLFVSIVYIVKQAKALNYLTILNNKKSRIFTFLILLLLGVFSAKPDLYGILLQLSAILCGVIVGSRLHKDCSDISVSTLIFGFMVTLVLMQPEFFRFGQLGNLTFIHLIGILSVGFFAITTLVLKYTNARSKIYESAYVKLKWLFRILGALALVLFVLTESVPVFLGLLAVVAINEMLTIYHSKQKNTEMFKQSWAWMLMCFGVVIICPVITCLGIVYLSQDKKKSKIKDFSDLL